MLNEIVPVTSDRLPIAALRDHLRLGRGFADVGAEDVALEAYLRAAIALIEQRISKALLTRGFLLRLRRWANPQAQPLPLAPLTGVTQVALRGADEEVAVLDAARYRLMPDGVRPVLLAVGGNFPPLEDGGLIEISVEAGFGVMWENVPADLRQAVMLLAAHYFEHRHESDQSGALPFGVNALIEPWRVVRLFGGNGGRG
ncbi:head-tail connector protein [Thioclava sp. GXIMD4216]|uniref:Head-tail connector protein n=1 Tax=Thioclava litoralis TaxID=3076557 RepID=A0ABZ1E0S9_9RHOB|nr:head-tail connector protein [Thioclava sp. FTW29]